MSNIDQRQTPEVSERDQATEGPTQYAPMPLFLPLMFLLAIGLVIAYGVVSR